MNKIIYFEQLPLILHVKDLVPLLSIDLDAALELVYSGQVGAISSQGMRCQIIY